MVTTANEDGQTTTEVPPALNLPAPPLPAPADTDSSATHTIRIVRQQKPIAGIQASWVLCRVCIPEAIRWSTTQYIQLAVKEQWSQSLLHATQRFTYSCEDIGNAFGITVIDETGGADTAPLIAFYAASIVTASSREACNEAMSGWKKRRALLQREFQVSTPNVWRHDDNHSVCGATKATSRVGGKARGRADVSAAKQRRNGFSESPSVVRIKLLPVPQIPLDHCRQSSRHQWPFESSILWLQLLHVFFVTRSAERKDRRLFLYAIRRNPLAEACHLPRMPMA